MMNCTEYGKYLKKFESGEADRSDLEIMRKHEQQCPKCARLRQLADTVQTGLDHYREETPPVPENCHEQWVRQLKEEKQTKPKSGRRVLCAAAAVLVLFILFLGGRNIPQQIRTKQTAAPMMDYASESMRAASEADYEEYIPEMSMGEMALTSTAGTSNGSVFEDETRKIVRTASIDISTAEFDKSLSLIHQMCKENGGWISSSSVVSKSGGMSASMTLRIPSDKLDTFLGRTGELGRIIRQDESAEDRTDSYRDTQSRLKTQKMLLERLQNLVTTSEKLEDLLQLERQIAEIQYNIDTLTSSLKSTDQQVNFSKVDISLKEEKKKEVVETREITFGERLSAALELGLSSFSESLQNMVLILAAMLPYLIAGICILLCAVFVIRRMKKKS